MRPHAGAPSTNNQINATETAWLMAIISVIFFAIGMFLGYYEANKKNDTLKMQALEKGYAEFDKSGEFRFKQPLTNPDK